MQTCRLLAVSVGVRCCCLAGNKAQQWELLISSEAAL